MVVFSRQWPGRYGAGWSESRETRGPRLGPRALVEPRDQAVDIDRGGDRDVLQVGFLEAPITGPPQPEGPHALREGPFDPRAVCILTLALGTSIPRPPGLEGLILLLGRQVQTPGFVLRSGTGGPGRTGTAVLATKLHNDPGLVGAVDVLRPTDRLFPLWTPDLLLLPIDRKLVNALGAVDLGLPTGILARRAQEVDPMRLPAVDEQLGTDIGGIDQVLLRRHTLVNESLLDRFRTHRFMDRGWRRVHLRQQVGRGGLTRLADVHHIPRPLRVAFMPIARLRIVGGFDAFRCWGQCAIGLEADAGAGSVAWGGRVACGPLVVALPGLTEGGNNR